MLTLIRHGQTQWSETGRHTGRTDVPLTDEGERQARRIGDMLTPRRFALALTSPLQRARRTAELAGLQDLQVDGDLVEWDYGGYEGMTTAEISADLGRSWTVFSDGVRPGATPGESLEQVAQRAERVLARVRPVLARGADVVVVGHGHQLRVLAARWLQLAPAAGALLRLSAGSLSRLGFEHDLPAIDLWNRTLDVT